MIRWFARNDIAANFLIVAILLWGGYSIAEPFRSLYQPFFVMLAVPFGAIGALFGHLILEITPSYLSIFGILALAGVVVNRSLVIWYRRPFQRDDA